jgi:hypothetical protein
MRGRFIHSRANTAEYRRHSIGESGAHANADADSNTHANADADSNTHANADAAINCGAIHQPSCRR